MTKNSCQTPHSCWPSNYNFEHKSLKKISLKKKIKVPPKWIIIATLYVKDKVETIWRAKIEALESKNWFCTKRNKGPCSCLLNAHLFSEWKDSTWWNMKCKKFTTAYSQPLHDNIKHILRKNQRGIGGI